MLHLKHLAAAAALCIGFGGIALAQQPSYSGRYNTAPDRYSTNYDRNSTVYDRYSPAGPDRSAPSRASIERDRYTTPRPAMPERRAAMGQFASDADARANCGRDTVVWVNTRSHVYHFAGASAYGHTKRGAFMCRADADRSGKFRAAKNEEPTPRFSGGSMPR